MPVFKLHNLLLALKSACPCLLAALILTVKISFAQTITAIVVEGNRSTKDYIILRELTAAKGDSIASEMIDTDRSRLLNLGIFSDVEIHAVPADSGLVYLILVQERFAIIPFPLTNYTEMNGWVYGGGVMHRNFTGRNRTLSAYLLIGGTTDYYILFADPWIAGNRISLSGEISKSVRDHPYEDFQMTETQSWIEIGFRKDYYWSTRLKFGYRSVGSDIPGITMSSEKTDILPFVKLTYVRDYRNLWSNPSQGYTFVSKLGQTGIPGQKPDYREISAGYSRFFPVKFGRTVGVNAAAGILNGYLPPYDRYYFGGTATMRGLPPNSARGNRIILSSIEYRFDIIKSRPFLPKADFGLGGTLFLDSGAVWSGGEDWLKISPKLTCGYGLRLFLPFVEILRLDIGYSAYHSPMIAFSAGAKF